MWIGNKVTGLVKFKDPATGVGDTSVPWGSAGTYLDGTGWAVMSRNHHKEQTLNWPFLRWQEVAQLKSIVNMRLPMDVLIGTEYQINALPHDIALPGAYAVPEALIDVPSMVYTISGSDSIPKVKAVKMWSFDGKYTPTVNVRIPPVPPGAVAKLKVWGYTANRGRELSDGQLVFNSRVSSNVLLAARMTLDAPDNSWEDWVPGMGSHQMIVRPDSPMQITQYSAPSANNYYSVSLTLIEVGGVKS